LRGIRSEKRTKGAQAAPLLPQLGFRARGSPAWFGCGICTFSRAHSARTFRGRKGGQEQEQEQEQEEKGGGHRSSSSNSSWSQGSGFRAEG